MRRLREVVRAWRNSRAWLVFRLVWATAGVLVMIYLVLSFSPWGVDDAVLETDSDVVVEETDSTITFSPVSESGPSRLLFIPGGIVHPHAYAPLLRGVAEAGHATILIKLPFLGRHAAGDAARSETAFRVSLAMRDAPGEVPWVVAGHSLGGLIASIVAQRSPERMRALVLLGTTHPREFSIADLPHPVVKVYGTRDGIAPLERSRANAANLPESTTWIAIEGGNHSQFGYYGFQIGDRRARISREEQQRQIAAILLTALERADDMTAADSAAVE